MPGKVRRAIKYIKIIEQFPVLALGTGKPHSRLTGEEYTAFIEGVALGLFDRIRQRNEKEADALDAAITHLKISFQLEVRCSGIESAKANVCHVIGRKSLPKLKHLLQPSDIELLREACELQLTLPAQSDPKKRKKWVMDHGLSPNAWLENDAVLIEMALGQPYHMSQYWAHKNLAGRKP